MKKKITSILVLCVMFLTLTLPVSASQTVSEEKQTRAQECGNRGNYGKILNVMSLTLVLPVSASQTVSEEKQTQAQECGKCGKMTLNTVRIGDYETGPTSKTCTHGYPYGDDLVQEKYTTYQYQCSNRSCLYKSATWDIHSDTIIDCHGHYAH